MNKDEEGYELKWNIFMFYLFFQSF
jgi:hypothetical protein